MELTVSKSTIAKSMGPMNKLSSTHFKNNVLAWKIASMKRKVADAFTLYEEYRSDLWVDAGAELKVVDTPHGQRAFFQLKDKDKREEVEAKVKELDKEEVTLSGMPKISLDMLKGEECSLTPDDLLALEWLITMES